MKIHRANFQKKTLKKNSDYASGLAHTYHKENNTGSNQILFFVEFEKTCKFLSFASHVIIT